jgi:hypothetical protein
MGFDKAGPGANCGEHQEIKGLQMVLRLQRGLVKIGAFSLEMTEVCNISPPLIPFLARRIALQWTRKSHLRFTDQDVTQKDPMP